MSVLVVAEEITAYGVNVQDITIFPIPNDILRIYLDTCRGLGFCHDSFFWLNKI